MTDLADEIDTAISQAVTGLRGFGYSWAEIGSRLGITRQAAQQRWGQHRMTAATAALDPEPLPGPGPGATADDTTATSPGRLPAVGTPARRRPAPAPTRSGSAAGSTPSTWPPASSPRLRHRHRAGECCTSPAATAAKPSARPARPVYKRDARQLVRAGLAGGKGIPETITAHPCVFATLTAPSFGPVHSRRMRGKTVLPCRPRRDANARRCPHGRDISCPTRHVEDDPRLGQPMCRDCYDYEAAVLFNAYAGDLWRRFTTYLPRHLARLAGVTQKQLRAAQLRIRYVKVAEYQARGVVHFHAVIRLDAPGEDYQPPPARYTAALLCDAIGQAAAAVTVAHRPRRPGRPARLRRRRPTPGPSATATTCPAPARPLDGQAVANYIAKYATKTLTVPGLPDLRLRTAPTSSACAAPAHYRQMITTAWQLGSDADRRSAVPAVGAHARLRRPLPDQIPPLLRHLRPAPRTPAPTTAAPSATPTANATPGAAPSTRPSSWSCSTWTYAGTGYTPPADAELAAASAARAREHHGQADDAA